MNDCPVSEQADMTLIRHGEVEPKWKTICYGAMDVPLSRAGLAASQSLATRLAAQVCPAAIYHSDLQRTRTLAKMIAEACTGRVSIIADARLRERNYGQWQGRSWDEAYASDPDNFIGLIEAPDTYRPPAGETTSEMQQRVVQWYEQCLPRHRQSGPVMAISHSGPIAALAGHLLGLHARDWQPWTIGNLESIHIQGSNIQRVKPPDFDPQP